MSVQPTELLQWATQRINEPGEVSLRALASRAYYAGYHGCLSFALKQKYTRPKGTGSHKALIDFLENHVPADSAQAKVVRSLAKRMRVGQAIRTRADYMIDQPFRKAHALELLDLAGNILRDISGLRT